MGEKGRVLTGARARLVINGKKVGYARNVSWTETIQRDELNVLDNIRVEERVAVKYRVSGTIQFARIVGETIKSMNLFPKAGVNKDEHLLNILAQGLIAIQVEDNKTNRIIALLEDADLDTNNCSVDAVGIAGKNVDFGAIVVRDESEA